MPAPPNPLLLLLLLLMVLSGAAPRAQHAPAPQREFRGVWVATVDNIDWPSKPGLPTAAARAELEAIVDRTAVLRLNAIVFQVRPSGDALYASGIEPWSEWLTGTQGTAPEPPWDPLQHLIEQARPRGIAVHAWCNPFRARHPAASSPEHESHVLRALPDACVRYGAYRWMDPGDPRAADWSRRVMLDLVRRYDVDGIHIDDYFYPYPEQQRPFPDDRSYARYRDSGGALARDDWRRANIDRFVRRLYEQTHAAKPAVAVGISPFGIARPGLPAGIKAGVDQYADLYADVLGWQRDGLCDYLSPQLYWPIDQEAQSFAVLLPWWNAQNPHRRHVWPGINPGRAAQRKPPWREGELVQQIELIRAQDRHAPGHVHFSFRALRGDGNGLAGQLLGAVYAEAAPLPASPWLPGEPPAAPELLLERDGAAHRVRVLLAAGTHTYCVQALGDRGWRTVAAPGAATEVVRLPAGTRRVTVRGLARNGAAGPPTSLPVGD